MTGPPVVSRASFGIFLLSPYVAGLEEFLRKAVRQNREIGSNKNAI